MNCPPLILASASPRRRELLDMMGLCYTVDASQTDEHCSGTPEEIVRSLSGRKAKAVADRHPDALVLGADTIVCLEGRVLGKPGTHERAEEMLSALSGRWHDVFTGITLIHTGTGRILQCVERTRVHFVNMTPEEIRVYAASDEPLDKAGAYAIQGRGGVFVDRIDGSYSNVVGLPLSAVRKMLAEI